MAFFTNLKCDAVSGKIWQNNNGIAKEETNKKIEKSDTKEILSLLNKEGWEIPGLSKSKINKPRNLFRNGSTDSLIMYWTWLQPNSEEGQETKLNDTALSKQQRETLRLLEGDIMITDIVQFDINNRPFCYLIKIHPRGIGATQGLHYYDEDGDGKFEMVEKGSALPAFVPRIPPWTEKK